MPIGLAHFADQTDMKRPNAEMLRRLGTAVTFSTLLFSAGALAAQNTGGEDAMSLTIEELAHAKVFSASKHLEDSRQAPSSVSVITAEDIRRYGWRTLGDALRSLRGFYTSYDRNYTYMGVRGFMRPGDYNTRVLLLVNGHRLNENVYDSALIGTEFPLDLDLVDHIEVVRGPSSSLFGANALFAVINVFTRKITAATTAEVSGDIGSFLGRTGRLTSNFGLGKLSGLVSGTLFRSAGQSRLFYPEFAAPETNNGWADNGDGDRFGKAFADLQYGSFRLQGLFSSRTKLIPTGSYETNFNDSSNRTTDKRAYADLSYNRTAMFGELDIHAYYDWYDYLEPEAYGGADPASRYIENSWAAASWAGTEASLNKTIGRQRIVAGAEYEYSFKVDQQDQVVGQPPVFSSTTQPSRAALYSEGELNLIPKLSIRLGGRLDWFDIYGTSLSPRIALVYSPSARAALKYIYGRAFRAPNAYENYYHDGVMLEAPAIPLKPETNASHEVVFERGLSSWAELTFDGSYNHLQDLIEQVPDTSTGLTQFVNVGRDWGRTLEIELAAKRSSGMAARASYTLTDSTDSIRQIRLANSPLHMAKANGTIPLFDRGFVALELLYNSAQKTFQGTTVQPSLLTNATISTKPIFIGWEISASCNNAINQRWYTPAGPGLQQSEIEQGGRTFLFKLSRRFTFERASQ